MLQLLQGGWSLDINFGPGSNGLASIASFVALQRDPNSQIPYYIIFLALGQVTDSLLDKTVTFNLH